MNEQTERPIISITGTSGKTTTKEMLASILQRRWQTFKSYENGNDVWFISQYVKQIDDSYGAVVLEFGLTHPGSITEQCKMIQPNIAVVTNVGMAHIEDIEKNIQGITDITGVASAKSELIQGMNQKGLLALNADDSNSKLLQIQGFQGKIITVGFSNHSDYYACDIQYTDRGMSFIVQLNGVKELFHIPIFGKHNVYNALFAIAVSHQLGFSPDEIRTGLEQFYRTQGRLNIHQLNNDITLINDAFNAKPCAMKSALDVINQIG
ncbi:MAG TPA: UDP-N-acetylmuramoyl-tripeptide--D-alanyl-D-alanine ligase, partial [Clostridia bacterium]